jgi:hypothetical protein
MKLFKRTMLVLGALAVIVVFVATVTPKAAHALAAALVQDVDQPARAPFQAAFTVTSVSGFTPVTIPAGKRLVIDFINIGGEATTNGTYVQPVVILRSTLGGVITDYNFAPTPSPAPTEYYLNLPTTIYTDNLSLGTGFNGSTPLFIGFDVVISGHLINVS